MQGILRQRKPGQAVNGTSENDVNKYTKRPDGIVWGKTPAGEVFRVPTTHDVLTALFHPSYPKTHFDLLNLSLLGLQLVLFFCLPRHISKIFFLFYFAFWRGSYDAGLGFVLSKQSKKKWIVREVNRQGWLDEKRYPRVRNWIRAQLVGKMGKDYSFDELPLEYNTWLLFRQVVDIILLNDFVAYCMFAFSWFRVPEGLSIFVHIMRWIGGFALIGFNLWVKVEAHNVLKVRPVPYHPHAANPRPIIFVIQDYAWFWGDTFFTLVNSNLVFDGVFELAPHPMYSIGYAGYYGLSLIVGSYPVLFVSLTAHAAQFAFLVFFENPHIERMYGQPKPIAERVPLFPTSREPGFKRHVSQSSTDDPIGIPSTPAATEGETATETDLDTDSDSDTEFENVPQKQKLKNASSSSSQKDAVVYPTKTNAKKAISHHDLLNKYFRRDTLLLHNVDLLRSSDFMLILVICYSLVISFLPRLSKQATVFLHFGHALAWCLFHCFGLGLLLRAQSRNKYLVRHYMKHYHYSQMDGGTGAIQEAFTNWKSIYNLSLCMTYISFIGVVWKTYLMPTEWSVGNELLRHTFGIILVALHIWAAKESYEVLGVFGWFFGDFFMEEFPPHLEYTGIYRYLNNPEIMGAAAWFGLALISASKLVVCLAVIRHLSQWWFLSNVENPHMRKLYGDSIRKDAGFVKVIKNVASKNVRLLESRAGRHAPELKRVAKEVKGTFDKVYEETAEAVEEFLSKSRPKLSEVMQDTKILLQQSRQRLVITRIATNIPSHDSTKYKIAVVPGADQTLRFHLGEPISVRWQAPCSASRKDWIGIYRVGANKSKSVTKISSMGMWVPVHDEEWDGDVPLCLDRPITPTKDSENGLVVFKGDTLPWLVGQYEFRYHHNGKHSVMGMGGPIEIYVASPPVLDFSSVRAFLMQIVPLCLDSDPSLMPLSCMAPGMPKESLGANDNQDHDDFRFWSERQAERICVAIKQAFEVEYVPEVVVADANLSALANRILLSKQILTT